MLLTKFNYERQIAMTSFTRTVYLNGEALGTTMRDSGLGLGCVSVNASCMELTDVNSTFQAVLVFLAMLSSGLQYLVQSLNYKRDLGRIESIVSQARTAAWGAKLVPTSEGQRKVCNLGCRKKKRGACLHVVSGESQPWRAPTGRRGWQYYGRQDGGHGGGRERRLFRKCLCEWSLIHR